MIACLCTAKLLIFGSILNAIRVVRGLSGPKISETTNYVVTILLKTSFSDNTFNVT